MIKRDSDLYKQHLQYEIRDYFLPEKIGKHALIWEQYQKMISVVGITHLVPSWEVPKRFGVFLFNNNIFVCKMVIIHNKKRTEIGCLRSQ